MNAYGPSREARMSKKSHKKKESTASETGEMEKVSFFKRVWQRYLKRLNKVTKGKPQCCK